MNQSMPTLENLPYSKDLRLILGYCKTMYPQFPVKFCQDSSRLIHKVLGLPVVAGIFDEMPYDGRANWHAWNRDRDRRLFIDLTASQFNSELPEILITSQDDERFLFKRENTAFARSEILDQHYDPEKFLRDYYEYAKNPSKFSMKGRKTIVRDLTPVSWEMVL